MKIIDFEKLVLEKFHDNEEFYKHLKENILEIEEDNKGHLYSCNNKVEHLETSTLEYLEEISNIPHLEIDKEEELLKRLTIEDKDEVISKNLKIPARVAALLLKDGIDYIDLVQEGTIALIKAVEHYRESPYKNFQSFAFLYTARWMILSIDRRLQETKSQFIEYFNHQKEEYLHNEELINELEKRIEKIVKIDYFSLENSLNENEYFLISRYYGLIETRNVSILELEKEIGLEKNQGEKIFQNAINKLSRFGGEMFEA